MNYSVPTTDKQVTVQDVCSRDVTGQATISTRNLSTSNTLLFCALDIVVAYINAFIMLCAVAQPQGSAPAAGGESH